MSDHGKKLHSLPWESVSTATMTDLSLPESEECLFCDSHFLNSSLLGESRTSFRLRCNACGMVFSLPNTPVQRGHLKNVYGVPSQVDQLVHISQLTEGDVIAYKRTAWLLKYEHHAIVTQVDAKNGQITVVEFVPDRPLRKGVIVKATRMFEDDIASRNAWVRRYMPLDALPLPEVLDRANTFVIDRQSQPKYDVTRFNCQHLSSWCKTGQLVSAGATTAQWIYFFTFHGLHIISLFVSPVATVGMSLLDTSVRVGRIIRTEIDLVRKEMANGEVIMRDIGSMAISTAVGLAALFLLRAAVLKR